MKSPLESNRRTESSGARGFITRLSGVYLVVASVVVGILSWLPLHLLSDLAAAPPYPVSEIPPLALSCVEHRVWMPLLALPALLAGSLLLATRRRSLTLVLLGSAALVIPFAVAVYCFLALIAPMYQYHEI